jgi:hypothetical protein
MDNLRLITFLCSRETWRLQQIQGQILTLTLLINVIQADKILVLTLCLTKITDKFRENSLNKIKRRV